MFYHTFLYSRIVLLFLSLIVIFQQKIHSESPTLADAQRLFSSIDRSINTIKWKCRKEPDFRLSDPNDPNSKLPRKEKMFEEYAVLYDMRSRHFLLQGEYCVPWVDGEATTITKEFAFSYDGKKYVYWEKRKKDNVYTKDDSGSASIMEDLGQAHCDEESFITSKAATAGFGTGFPGKITLCTPNYAAAVSLSELLLEWKSKKVPVILQETEDKKWKMEGIISWSMGADRHIHVFCDPFRDGIVNEYIRFFRSKNKDHIEEKMTVEFTQNSQGKFVPSMARLIYPLDKLMTEFHYTDVEFNPKVNDESFQFKIPDGSYVTDYITKTYYKVGDLVDEDKAISDFMTRYNLTGNVPKTTTAGGIVRYVLIVVGGLMILASIVLYFRKRMQA
jgi:hypothetical protein